MQMTSSATFSPKKRESFSVSTPGSTTSSSTNSPSKTMLEYHLSAPVRKECTTPDGNEDTKRWSFSAANWRNGSQKTFNRRNGSSSFHLQNLPSPSLASTRSRKLSGDTVFSASSPQKPITQIEAKMEYLADLVNERKQLATLPDIFPNLDKLLSQEIDKVRSELFVSDFTTSDLQLPEPSGETTTVTEKVYVPTRQFPEYNFVGRILGPRGMTAKQLENETGCKIMVRGKGSMREKKREEANRGKPNWEHLDDELHVLLQCEDTEERAKIKLRHAKEQLNKLLVPVPEGSDELKRKQLIELAIINGTYRPIKSPSPTKIVTAVPLLSPLRTNVPPMLLSPLQSPTSGLSMSFGPNSPPLPPTSAQSFASNNAFDYSSFMSNNLLEQAMQSLRMQGDYTMPSYPTTTSVVNSFPSLFASPMSQTDSSEAPNSP